MINLEDIKGNTAIRILESYSGKNPYIKKLKATLIKQNGTLALTDFQSKYIIRNHEVEPIHMDKVVTITEYLGESLQKSENLSFKPQRVLIEFMLGETEKTFHIYGKMKRNQPKAQTYFIPKSQVLEDPYFEEKEVEVDFEKYEKLDTYVLDDGTVGRKFYDHQKSGIKFLRSRDGAILADVMGLGKSMQSIVAALDSGVKKILIVCPSAVKINWQREINYFQEYDTAIINGKEWKDAKFTIINFDILKNFHQLPDKYIKAKDIKPHLQTMIKSRFELCIIDEAHKLKNKDSKRGSIMKEVCKYIPKVWLLSGTPVANRPMDYYNLLKLIKTPITDNWKHFVQRYCKGRQITTKLKNGGSKKVWLTKGAENLQELAFKTKHLLLRRLKDVIKDMPEKNIILEDYKMSKDQELNYEELWEEYLINRKLNGKKGVPQKELVELGLLRKFVAMEMIPNTIKLTEDIIEQDEKVIIFTNFTDELLTLQQHFGNKCVTHHGSMSDIDKQSSIDRFQKDKKVKVFIGNIISAGVGITLTKSSYVIFNSFDWVPGNNEQAEDRSHRIGQPNNVTVYYQLFSRSGLSTISEIMWRTVKSKKEIIDLVIGENGIDEDAAVENILKDIMLEYE